MYSNLMYFKTLILYSFVEYILTLLSVKKYMKIQIIVPLKNIKKYVRFWKIMFWLVLNTPAFWLLCAGQRFFSFQSSSALLEWKVYRIW